MGKWAWRERTSRCLTRTFTDQKTRTRRAAGRPREGKQQLRKTPALLHSGPGCQPDSDELSEQRGATARVSFPTAVGYISEKEELTFLGSAGSVTAELRQPVRGSGELGRGGRRGSEQREWGSNDAAHRDERREGGRSSSVGGKQSLNYPNCLRPPRRLLQAAGVKQSHASQLCRKARN